ncbi:Phosphoglycolate phosphatase [Candidatus Tiddalikarchaeum anstoanum]|nr:Phosphoglycolate phosphatase [Candidatus Tiddalikarchaeum anstoanum]
MLIILDLDGTIINSQLQHLDSFVRAIKKVTGKESNAITNTIKNMFGIPGDKIIKTLFPDSDEKLLKDILIEVNKILFDENLQKITLADSVKDFLERVHKNHIIALATSANKKFATTMLAKFKIEKYFKILITREDVVNPKPDPELLIKCISKAEVEKSDAVSIGDSIYDFEAAKSLGIKFIGVLEYSFFKEKLLKVATCVNDFSEILI